MLFNFWNTFTTVVVCGAAVAVAVAGASSRCQTELKFCFQGNPFLTSVTTVCIRDLVKLSLTLSFDFKLHLIVTNAPDVSKIPLASKVVKKWLENNNLAIKFQFLIHAVILGMVAVLDNAAQ